MPNSWWSGTRTRCGPAPARGFAAGKFTLRGAPGLGLGAAGVISALAARALAAYRPPSAAALPRPMYRITCPSRTRLHASSQGLAMYRGLMSRIRRSPIRWPCQVTESLAARSAAAQISICGPITA